MTLFSDATRRVKRGWMNLCVTRVIDETHDTKTFIMEDADEGGRPFDYVAGQYLTFRFDGLVDKPIVRSYTMSSSPVQGNFSAFTVKRVEGGLISNWLCDRVQVGTVLKARGPIGRFVYDPAADKKHLVMVAGGSGVTPFVSIMREHAPHLGQPGHPERMTLVVSFKSRQDLICWPDLCELEAVPGVQILTTLSRDNLAPAPFLHGRISADCLAEIFVNQCHEVTVMSCGPQAIMDQACEVAASSGIPLQQIKTESFES